MRPSSCTSATALGSGAGAGASFDWAATTQNAAPANKPTRRYESFIRISWSALPRRLMGCADACHACGRGRAAVTFPLLQQPGLHFFLRQQLHANALRLPDVFAILADGAIRGELARARGIEDGHARPAILVAVGLVHQGLAVRVGLVVREH